MTGAGTSEYRYWMPTRIVFGEGALSHLPDAVGDLASRVFVVSTGAMHRFGVLDRIQELLGEDRTVVFSPVPPNPTPDAVDEPLLAVTTTAGVTEPYQRSDDVELTLDTSRDSVKKCSAILLRKTLSFLRDKS